MAVFVKEFAPDAVDRREVLRYAGARAESDELSALLDECIAEAKFTCRACYAEVDVTVDGDQVTLGELRVTSASLAKNLANCSRAVLFAATVGVGIDRLIARYGHLSPAKALLLQALGAERIESLCDSVEAAVTDGRAHRPRFSPGYGDLALATQKDLFALLDCPRKIGLSLNESLLMSPSKSVTAIVGLCERE